MGIVSGILKCFVGFLSVFRKLMRLLMLVLDRVFGVRIFVVRIVEVLLVVMVCRLFVSGKFGKCVFVKL